MKIYAEAYGCALNRGEAGMIVRALQMRGHMIDRDPLGADAILVATCVVIDATERKVLKRIRELSALGVPMAVTGCAGPTCGDKVRRAAPNAKLFGPGDVEGALSYIAGLSGASSKGGQTPVLRKHIHTGACGGHPKKPRIASVSRIPFTERGDKVCPIPIASGCLGSCSYCITKNARGTLRSRPKADIVEEAKGALASGAVELQLCAQDSGVYGLDIGSSLPELIRTVASLDGDFMIRVGMMNPGSVKGAFGELMDAYDNPKVFKFLHLPFQSGDDSVLASMERRHSVDEALRMMETFRPRFPESTISTDVIVGYPEESQEAHEATVRFLESARPDVVNVTRFSPRPGTAAAEMAGVPHGRTVKARSRELTALRKAIAEENNSRFAGKTFQVLATETGRGETTIARTPGYRQTIVPGRLPLGKRYVVRIIRTNSINLFGKIV